MSFVCGRREKVIQLPYFEIKNFANHFNESYNEYFIHSVKEMEWIIYKTSGNTFLSSAP